MSEGLCSFCEEPVDIRPEAGNYRKVTGWHRMRPKGANEVKLVEDLHQYMHKGCMQLFKAGISPDQEQLF